MKYSAESTALQGHQQHEACTLGGRARVRLVHCKTGHWSKEDRSDEREPDGGKERAGKAVGHCLRLYNTTGQLEAGTGLCWQASAAPAFTRWKLRFGLTTSEAKDMAKLP